MAERKRVMTNTVQGAVAQFKSAKQVLQPKMKLTKRERELFDEIVSSAETSVWNGNRLFIASNLAVIYRRMEEISHQLNVQGVTLVNERGTQIANPLFSAFSTLSGTCLSMNKTLGLSAPQQGASGGAQEKRNIADAHAREVVNKAKGEEDLLA